MPSVIVEQIHHLFQAERQRLHARLVVSLGDFDLAEDGLQEAFAAALNSWPEQGMPDNPNAWLFTTARFKAIDRIRSLSKQQAFNPDVLDYRAPPVITEDVEEIGDELLRLIFTCCHPELSQEAQVALTLREVCGLTTEEIAHAFLLPVPTLAQRIVRAKTKLRESKVPFESPGKEAIPLRLPPVLRTVYLVFNEGYNSASGTEAIRLDLCQEAIRLGHLLAEMLPEQEVLALLALMLLHDARKSARTDSLGDIIRLEDQDRSQWNQEQIAAAEAIVRRSMAPNPPGVYAIQAAICAIHATAPTYQETDWEEIVALYDILLRTDPNPVVALNRAVAVAMVQGPEAGLVLVNALIATGIFSQYHYAYVARAELHRQASNLVAAREDYETALKGVQQEPERRLIERRLSELPDLGN